MRSTNMIQSGPGRFPIACLLLVTCAAHADDRRIEPVRVALEAAEQAERPAASGEVTSSLVARSMQSKQSETVQDGGSLFTVNPPKPRKFLEHDLVQIIVQEVAEARSEQELDTDKRYGLGAEAGAWTTLNFSNIFAGGFFSGTSDEKLPVFEVEGAKEFDGEGDYRRKDYLTARITAEVLEVLPNGNLVLEARSTIITDEEKTTMKLTGICRQADITAANTLMSYQLHDARIEKIHSGEVRNSATKGILAKALDFIFAF